MSIIYADVPGSFFGVSGVWGEAIPNGQPAVAFPLATEGNYARVYSQPFIVNSGADVTGAFGTAGIFPETYLVAETDRAPLAGGFVGFERVYAEIPSGHNDYQTFTYTFPAMDGNWRPQWKTLTVVARTYNDFIVTDTPQSITLSGAQRWLNSYGWDAPYLTTSTVPTKNLYSGWVYSGAELIAQDATVSRYVGPIWRRQTLYVKAQ